MTDFHRIRLRARGRVQGVGFRWFVRERARSLGVAGWVRNEADGSVVVEAEGPAAALDALRHAVARGPEAARVEAVDTLPPGDGPLPQPFGVER